MDTERTHLFEPPTGPSVLPDHLRVWVEQAAHRGTTPQQLRTWLTSVGWPGVVADAAALEVERLGVYPSDGVAPPPGPDRAHEHVLAYATLFVAVGLSALALGSTVHLLLEWAVETTRGSRAIADWLTVLVCAVPFAVIAARAVRRIELHDPLARLSHARESLSLVLLWAAGVVGASRLLLFVHRGVSALVVDRDVGSLGRDVAHVLTVVTIAGSVFWWTWRFRAPRTQGRDDQAPKTWRSSRGTGTSS